jgi:hypothetical protein
MFEKKLMLAPLAAAALGVTLAAGGGGSELSLRIPNETAPPGGMVQMKVTTTEVTPISGGRTRFGFDRAVFGGVAGFGLAAPGGEAAGAAVVDGAQVQIFYTGTSLLTGDYPILTVVLPVRADAVPGSRTQFTLDDRSLWNFSTSGLVSAKPISPATVTVGGANAVSISDVVPGEGVWPAGTIVSVRGAGFSSRTNLRVNDAGAKSFNVVSPTELRFTLTQPTEMRGLRLSVSGQSNSSTYYAYLRSIASTLSARTLLASTEPIFAVAARAVSTFGPIPQLSGNQYAAIALQNPTADAVELSVALYDVDGTLIHTSSLTLDSRHRIALEVSELLDGVAPPAGASIVVTADAPIDAISLLCDEGPWTVAPSLSLEALR